MALSRVVNEGIYASSRIQWLRLEVRGECLISVSACVDLENTEKEKDTGIV